jgi:hypothetical protein
MSLSSRALRRSVLSLLWMLSAACIAQGKPQFVQPEVELTGGRVASFLTGHFVASDLTDILYINAYTTTATAYQVTVGELLDGQAFTNLDENRIAFQGTLNVAAALGDFNGDGIVDYAFALSPISNTGSDLCVYYGTGLGTAQPGSYYPLGTKSGCTTFPTKGQALPNFAYAAAAPFKSSSPLPQLVLEDSNNNFIYVLANNAATGNSGTLPGFTVASTIAIPAADGPGAIYTGDFNGDGNTDFIVNGQNALSASVYFGNGDGTFQAPVYLLNHAVHSMLLQDMDGDGIADLVVEGDNGVIEIFHGNGTTANTFAAISEGGTAAGLNGFSGNGGHLAAIGKLGADTNLDILTTTPIGLSVLEGQGEAQGVLTYKLKGIYNVGPGRSAFALANFFGAANLDLAVDSPEGIAIVQGNSDGSFQTSNSFAAGQPGLNATIDSFRNNGNLDVVVATGAVQAQVLTGNGDGTFNTLPAPANATVVNPYPTLWSNLLTSDFDGDGNEDLLYSLTGLPLPTPGANAGSGLYLQYGNGDGTFKAPQPVSNQFVGAPADNNFFGETAVADVNGDGIPDIVNLDTHYYDTLLSQKNRGAFKLGLSIKEESGESDKLDSFREVATGILSGTGSHGQDLIFQDDATVTPYKNNGDGTFTAEPALATPPPANQLYDGVILFTDIDNDGNGDIVVPYHNLAATPANPNPASANLLYIWYGNGDGTFQAPVIATLSRNYYLAAVADMNGDGLPDIVLSDGYLVAILYNQGNRSFGAEQHFLAGQGINSLALADINGDGAVDLVVANGGATISAAVAIGGLVTNSAGISLTPNPDVNTGGITVLLNKILTRPVTGSVVAAPEPSKQQSGFTLNATLNPSTGVSPPNGTVQFSVGGAPVGEPVAVVQGATSSTASYTVPAGNAIEGSRIALSAAYSGDNVNSPATLYGTHAVMGSATTTTLALCVGPTPACPSTGLISPPYMAVLTMSYGQTFNGSIDVSDFDGSPLTGTIAFDDDYNGVTTTLCTLSVAVGASCPPSVGMGTPVGPNIFTAMYSGDATHAPSSSMVTITVLRDANSGTLTSSAPSSPFGQPVTFTATFTGNFAPPAGTVVFLNGATVLGAPVTLVPNATNFTSTATFITSTLPVGTDPITASYAATLDFAAATTRSLPQVITPVFATASTLTSSANPSGTGESVTFTATVADTGGSGPVPAGTVTFLDGGATLGTGTLNGSGVATFTTSSLTVGSHQITASFPGGGTKLPSSAMLTQVVLVSSFTVTVTPTPVSIGVGRGASLTVTVTTQSGFSPTVSLTCTNLPTEAACIFGASVIASGGGQTTLLLTTTAPHTCGSTQPYFLGGNGGLPGALPALAGLGALLLPGRRRWLRSMISVVAVAGVLQIAGCGTCTDLGTRPATYTIQAVGTASGTGEVESQPVTMTVTL